MEYNFVAPLRRNIRTNSQFNFQNPNKENFNLSSLCLIFTGYDGIAVKDFYDTLQHKIDLANQKSKIILFANLNAKVGKTYFELMLETLAQYYLGETNGRELRFLQIYALNNLVATAMPFK